MSNVIELFISPADDVVRGLRQIADSIEAGTIAAMTHAVLIFEDESNDVGLTLLGDTDEKASLGLTMLGTQMLTNAVLGID
jgi:hypothetical protein